MDGDTQNRLFFLKIGIATSMLGVRLDLIFTCLSKLSGPAKLMNARINLLLAVCLSWWTMPNFYQNYILLMRYLCVRLEKNFRCILKRFYESQHMERFVRLKPKRKSL